MTIYAITLCILFTSGCEAMNYTAEKLFTLQLADIKTLEILKKELSPRSLECLTKEIVSRNMSDLPTKYLIEHHQDTDQEISHLLPWVTKYGRLKEGFDANSEKKNNYSTVEHRKLLQELVTLEQAYFATNWQTVLMEYGKNRLGFAEPLLLLIRLGCYSPFLFVYYVHLLAQTEFTYPSIKEMLAGFSSWEEFSDFTGIEQTMFVRPYSVYFIKSMANKVLPIIKERKQELKKTETVFGLEISEKKMLTFHDVIIKSCNQF